MIIKRCLLLRTLEYFRNCTSSYYLPELKLEVLNVFLRHPPDVPDCDGWTTFGVQVGEVQPIRTTLHWVGGGQFGSLKRLWNNYSGIS